MMHWNMARFAEALLPAINAVDPEGVEEAKTIVDGIPDRFRSAWLARMRGKLGIAGAFDGEGDLIDGLFEALERHGVDFTGFFRALAALLRGDGARSRRCFPNPRRWPPGSRTGGNGSDRKSTRLNSSH